MTDGGGARFGGLGMLASALAGRAVAVCAGEPDAPSWTDGSVIYLDPAADPGAHLESVAVQASMIGAGSLAPDCVAGLVRHRRTAQRYLAIEGHRALLANEAVLPGVLAALAGRAACARSDSPAASLAIAAGRSAVEEPPPNFGTLEPRKLLAAHRRAAFTVDRETPGHVPRRSGRDGELTTLDDSESDDTDGPDAFTSPVGDGGFIGTWFAKLLSSVRKTGSGGGPPGADVPTHRVDSANRGSHAVSSLATASSHREELMATDGVTYPEWDEASGRYRPHWCTVREVDPEVRSAAPQTIVDSAGVRRPLARLGMGFHRRPRQSQGHDVDVDAAVAARVDMRAGSVPDEAVYTDSVRRRRDLSVLVLLDVSGSTAEPGSLGRTVHEHQREAAAQLVGALHDLGDRVALYGFFSAGRKNVTMLPVKRFGEPLGARVMRRLDGLEPGAFSRLGAAIRHGSDVVESRGGTPRRLLVVVSDGLAYDHGYERGHGAADARRALAEARRRGIGCVCLTVGANTDAASLRRVFDSTAHAAVGRADLVAGVIGPLLRSALRAVEAGRRAA